MKEVKIDRLKAWDLSFYTGIGVEPQQAKRGQRPEARRAFLGSLISDFFLAKKDQQNQKIKRNKSEKQNINKLNIKK